MSNPIRTLIVDDEPLARQGLSEYVSQIDFLQEIGQAKNGIEAMKFIQQGSTESIELLLLDIQMPGLSGTELVESLRQPPAVIFTTAHPSFAVQGFELEALDYLLKPITFPRFLKAVIKAQERLRPNTNSGDLITEHDEVDASQAQDIFIKVEGRIERILLADIRYVESLQNYCRIISKQGEYLPLIPLKELIAALPTADFVQIHRSYVVSVAAIAAIEGGQVRVDGQLLPMSRARRTEVEKRWLRGRIL